MIFLPDSAPIDKWILMEVLEALVEPDHQVDREKEFIRLYELSFPASARYISKMGGTFQEAQDVFQDALVIYHEKTQDPAFTLQNTPAHYILGIVKHLWSRKFNQQLHWVPLDANENTIAIPDDYFPTVDSQKLLMLLVNSGKRCMELLRTFYYEKLPLKQIAGTLGYTTPHAAAVQKYKCLEKVRDTIKEKAISYEDFIE